MHPMVSRLLRAGVLAGGLIAVGAGVAHADDTTTGQRGTLSGNQIVLPLTLPISVTDTPVAVAGRAGHPGAPTGGPLAHPLRHRHHHHHAAPGSSTTGAGTTGSGSNSTTPPASPSATTTSGASGLGSGNQVRLPLTVPVTVAGDPVAVLGRAGATGSTGSSGSSGSTGATSAPSGGLTTSGQDGALSGNQVVVPLTVPVTASGDPMAVLGTAGTGSAGGAAPVGGTASGTNGAATTSGAGGTGSGNQVVVPVTVPVTVATDPVAVVGTSTTGGGTGGGTGAGTGGEPGGAGTGSGSTAGSSVLGENVSQAAAAPAAASLAMTGGLPVQLVELGILFVGLGVAVRHVGSTP